MPKKSLKKPFSAAGQVWLSRDGENVLNESRIALLEKIAETGSITQAGKAVGISYRTAWIMVDHLNALSDSPLVERTAGGKSGGGTRLTPHGSDLLRLYRILAVEHGKYLERLREGIRDFDRFLNLARKISLKTSARNQFFGVVESIRKDGLNVRVALRLKGGDGIVSRITVGGLESLGLREGEEAYALIKANWISLIPSRGSPRRGTGDPRHGIVPTGPENKLAGKIISLRNGKLEAEAEVLLAGGTKVVALIPSQAVREAKLAEGVGVTAGFDASNVILGVAG